MDKVNRNPGFSSYWKSWFEHLARSIRGEEPKRKPARDYQAGQSSERSSRISSTKITGQAVKEAVDRAVSSSRLMCQILGEK